MPNLWIAQTHPLYTKWLPVWQLLSEVYEGDGGFLDGTHIIAHPRECNYAANGDWLSDKPKLVRRRQIARYENYAATIVDGVLDHLYTAQPQRVADDPKLDEWWQDVDGHGTHIDDWMKGQHSLSAVYGHLFVVLDRERAKGPNGTRADQGQPILRTYTPVDVPDWLAADQILQAIKCVEAVERTGLDQPILADADDTNEVAEGSGAASDYQYRLWDGTTWQLYDSEGAKLDQGDHGMGLLPVVVFYNRKRARIPIIGRSLLRDPKLFKDHFNLISEEREILRSQTFSMMNVALAENETPDDARANLGDSLSTESVMYTRGGPATYLSPDPGPSATYAAHREALTRTIFRLIGLPWEGDSKDAESANSRRLKAMDLNRLLAGMADEAERVDYQIAALWYRATYGPEQGMQRFGDAGPTIKYPDDFYTQDLLQVLTDTQQAMTMKLGATAARILRERLIPIVLPDLMADDEKTIREEIATTPVDAPAAANQFRADLLNAVAPKIGAAPKEVVPKDAGAVQP
jgi:hypothetical protein